MKGLAEIKEFAGSLDLDSPNEVIAKGALKMARNIEFFGTPPNMRAQSIKGTTLIPNALLPGTGTNLTIGAHYDAVNQRIFIFNWNSTGFNGIYIYYTLQGTFVTLIQDGTGTNGSVLNFGAYPRIDGVEILYGDANVGDLLFFIDSGKRPRKLNINRLLAGTYNAGGKLIQDSYLSVIKAPAIIPPQCVYENDTTVTINNLVNSLFKFSYTLLYDDLEESVLSSACAMALPSDPFDPTNNTPVTRNARIRLYLQTGDQNVKKIRIYGKQTKDGTTTDWFIVDTLIKADLGIADNGTYQYLFFNNGNYVAADPKFTVLLEDDVPQQANCQALLNGTTISYAGITEGYPFFDPSIAVTAANITPPRYTVNGTLFYAATNGLFTGSQPQITIYLTGVGVNDGFGNPSTLEKPPSFMQVRARSGLVDKSFSYTNTTFTAVSDILNGLSAAAVTAGWTVVGTTANSLTVYYPTGNVILQSSSISGVQSDTSPNKSPSFAFYPQANYAWGVVYYDTNGRTNGVISNIKVQSNIPIATTGQIAEITIGLAGYTPPSWAVYYHLVRTDNLTYEKYLGWISTSAYSNTGALVPTQYAYLGLANISYYNIQIKATEGAVSYGFSQGDRVRITGRYAADGTFVTLNYDYAILGEVINPVVNGQVQVGSFLQIAYPAADVAASGGNYGFDGTSNFQNYQILIYSYKAQNANTQNVYFEIGQEYGIGNPGTNTAYHMGNVSDNTIKLTDGDIFYRQRTVPLANEYYVNCGTFTQNSTYQNLWVNPGGGGTPIVDNGVWSIIGGLPDVSGLLPIQNPTYANIDWTVFNKSASAFNVRFQQSITVTDTTDPNGQWGLYIKVVLPGNIVSTYVVIPIKTGLAPGVVNTYSYDVTISLPASAKMWFISYAVNQMTVAAGELTIDIIRNKTLGVFDKSFSDIFNLVTNSDNRPDILDATARQTYFSTLFRFSQPFQLGTNINNTNRFYPNNFDEWDKSYGAVIRLRVRQRELRIFQERRCGHTGIYAKYIADNSGVNTLVTTDLIITPNNVEYFEGEFGIGNQPSGLCSSGYADYFPDPVKGYWLRLSLDGIQPISELYKVQSFAGTNLPIYLNNYNYQFGGTASIISCYNFKKTKEGEAIFCLQGGTANQLTFTGPGGPNTVVFPAIFTMGPTNIPGQSIAFDEKYNAWTSLYDFVPDAMVCAENTLYSFYNGQMYSHTDNVNYCRFYGTQYNPSIKLVFNDNMAIKKKYLAIAYQSNQIWVSPTVGDINTSMINPQTGLPQISQLISQDYEINENIRYAAFLFDGNSMANMQLAIVQGDFLNGNWIEVNLVYQGSGFAFIYLPYIKYAVSPRNL